jgi:hypothetical protein
VGAVKKQPTRAAVEAVRLLADVGKRRSPQEIELQWRKKLHMMETGEFDG